MKSLVSVLAVGAVLTVGAVVGQDTPSYSFSDISLYNAKTPERFGVFSGEPQTIFWNNGRIELSKPVTIALNGFVVPRTLAVNGSNTLRLELDSLNAFDGNFVGDQIQVRAKRNLQSVYYFDGTKWFTVTRGVKINEAAQFKPTPRLSPLGAGVLSSEEALSLAKYLSPKGELLLATLPETEASDDRLNLVPAPSAYRRSVLAVQYGVPRSPAPTISNLPSTAVTPKPPVNNPPSTNLIVPVVQTLEVGNNAFYSGGETMTRFDDSETEFAQTWKLVSGNQIPLPVAPRIDFSKSRVVTVFLGQRPTSGYGIQYKSASLEGNILQLRMQTSSPSPDRMVNQVMTSPFVMLEIKNTQFVAVQVEFDEK